MMNVHLQTSVLGGKMCWTQSAPLCFTSAVPNAAFPVQQRRRCGEWNLAPGDEIALPEEQRVESFFTNSRHKGMNFSFLAWGVRAPSRQKTAPVAAAWRNNLPGNKLFYRQRAHCNKAPANKLQRARAVLSDSPRRSRNTSMCSRRINTNLC